LGMRTGGNLNYSTGMGENENVNNHSQSTYVTCCWSFVYSSLIFICDNNKTMCDLD